MADFLPSFKKPPVVETVLGVQFDPIPGLTNGHLGAFWSWIGRERWPTVKEAPALAPEFERFGEEREWMIADTFRFGFTQVAPIRLQITNLAGDRMIQIQNGRFYYNWIGNDVAEYARYKVIRPEFDRWFADFQRFVSDEKLPALRLNLWEVTYVNHLPRGTVWNTVDDWQKVFNFQNVPPVEVNNCRLENIVSEWVYEIAPRRGRLRANLRNARTSPTGTDVLAFTLTARGPVGEGEENPGTLEAGLDLGHDVIVNSFAEFASPEARKYWREETC